MKGATRFMAVFDNHGDWAVKSAVNAALEFKKHFKPEIRIHGGDCFEFAALRKKADDQEKREPLQEDVDAGCAFLRAFGPTVFLRGNHDERLHDMRESDDAKLSEYAQTIIDEIDDSLGNCRVIPYGKRIGIYRLGDTNVIHGYNTGIYAARHAAAAFGKVILGHVHADDVQSVPRIDGAVGHSIGCLCELDRPFNRGQLGTLRQCHGFAYGFVRHGITQIFHATPIDGKWILPTEFREFHA